MVVMTRHDNHRTSRVADKTDEVNLLGQSQWYWRSNLDRRNNYTSNEGKEAIQYGQ